MSYILNMFVWTYILLFIVHEQNILESNVSRNVEVEIKLKFVISILDYRKNFKTKKQVIFDSNYGIVLSLTTEWMRNVSRIIHKKQEMINKKSK